MIQIAIFIMIVSGLLALDSGILVITKNSPEEFLQFFIFSTVSLCSFCYLKTEENP